MQSRKSKIGIMVVAVTVLLGSVAVLILQRGERHTRGRLGPTGLAALHVPKGFRVEQVAGPDLVSYPMLGTLDDRGRLFVCESSGNNNVPNEYMAAHPNFRVRMLEDRDGDGIYDHSTVFADRLTLPAGAVWYRGSLYVASPPDLLRFEDTNGDGVADQREVVVTGWNLASNAASLHGPFLGPDGWLYLTDGRHGYKIKTKEGTLLEGQASRIWRVRPDGTGLEWVAGGGFDNPVELVFTPAGEIIGTMTYFTDPQNGQRDALLHFVEGGVYPKPHPVIREFKRTGDLMPVMTKFARIAPSGLLRYRGTNLGPEYDGNLFSAQFNPHRVQRHILFREGATFRTEDEDFLTSSDPDFHPTDVLEDADGSLLVVDTGAWFIHGCPISRVAKPAIKGAIYRVRRESEQGSRTANLAAYAGDPRGRSLNLATTPPAELDPYLKDPRFAVRDKVLDLLVQAGGAAISPLLAVRESATSPQAYPPEARCAAVFGLARIAEQVRRTAAGNAAGAMKAEAAVRAALDDPDLQVRVAAARAAGMAKDRDAIPRLEKMVRQDQPAARRQAATALGQIGDRRATLALLAAASVVSDRFIEHAIIYSLMVLRDPAVVAPALKNADPKVRKAALIALDQMDGAPLRRAELQPFLRDPSKELRRAALWVVSHYPDWSGEVLAFLRSHLLAPEFSADEAEPVREAVVSFCADAAVQTMVADVLGSPGVGPDRQLFLLDTIDQCPLKEFPASWVERLGQLCEHADNGVRLRAVLLIRSRGIGALDLQLERIASDPATPDDLRTAALGVVVARHRQLDDASFQFLLGRLQPSTDAALRLSAAQVLGRAEPNEAQLRDLAGRSLPQADPLVLPSLLDAFHNCRSEQVGLALVAALRKNPDTASELVGKRLEVLLKNYPQKVQVAAKPLFETLEQEEKSRLEQLRRLEPVLTGGGDIGRGRRIFFGQKVACSRCHTIGMEGGHVGPDLTAVGAIRSGHDLLEAIAFPSASFVPGYEPYRVETAEEVESGIIVERTPDAIVLVSGPNERVRIARNKILSMKPSTVSLMPDGLYKSLTPSEFRDLLAFLQAQKTRESAQNLSEQGGEDKPEKRFGVQ